MANVKKLFRPSSAPALMLCPFYRSSGDGNNDADLGTQMHEYAQALLMGKDPVSGEDMDATHEECCHDVVAKICKVLDKYCQGWTPSEVECEVKVGVVSDDLTLITEGTLDIVCRSVIVDLKACLDFDIDNHYHQPQLDCYSLAWMQRKGIKEVHQVEAFIMPKMLREDDRTYDDVAATIECIVGNLRNPNKRHQPCEYCKWCERLLRCPAINERIAVVEKNYGNIGEWVGSLKTETDPQRISIALGFAKVLVKWHDKIKDIAMEYSNSHIDNEEAIPGFVRKKKVGTKNITNMNRAYNLSGVSTEGFQSSCKIVFGKLIDAFRTENGGTIKAAREEVYGRLDEVINVGEPSVSLSPVKRKSK